MSVGLRLMVAPCFQLHVVGPKLRTGKRLFARGVLEALVCLIQGVLKNLSKCLLCI